MNSHVRSAREAGATRPGAGRRIALRLLAAGLLALLVAACGSSSGGSGKTGSLEFAAFDPFSGPDAAFGPEQMAGCAPAARLIEVDGGILGHKTVTCNAVDTRGDPADAVPAARNLLATASGLAAVIGPSSDESSATVPIFNSQHIPTFANTGQALFDHSKFPYFWRPFPADDANGYVMALWAYQQGYRRAAAVFGTDISSQGAEKTAVRAFEALGGKVVITQNIPLDQASYRTEVTQLGAAHPQVIFHEADPQTSSTYFSQLKQIGHLIPIVGSSGTAETPWVKAVSKSIGTPAFDKYNFSSESYAPPSGPAWSVYHNAVLADASQVQKPLTPWFTDAYAMGGYDSVNIVALAMLAAHSTDPAVFNSHIQSITAPSPGAVKVYSFAQGKAALAKHERIQYVGASGVLDFNKWHNSNGDFEVLGYHNGPTQKVVATFTPADVARVSGQ
jgi:branched-chain amino acid transport system substrate-binding protein